jgi:serine phosphatase RsbU (regulator of sigma subunit)
MNSIKYSYFRVLNIGIDRYTPSEKILKIKVVNGFAAIAGTIMFIATMIIIYISQKDAIMTDLHNREGTGLIHFLMGKKYSIFIIFDFLSVIICLTVIFLNHLKKYSSAILLLCIFSNLIVSYYYWLRGGMYAFYFFVPIMIPVIFFDKKNWYIPFILSSLVIMFILTFILNSKGLLFRIPSIDTSEFFIFLINFIITYLIVFHIAFRFKKENLRYETELRKKNKILELQTKKIVAQRDALMKNKVEIEKKNNNITDSINYAKNIQTALLSRHDLLDQILPDHFILLKPRDIVSGDFYWYTYIEKLSVIAAVDCTGHGVPGAFMSMLGSAFLNEIVNKEYITHPGVILRRLRKEVIQSLSQKGESGGSKDGMDLALCVIDDENKKLQFAGANNPLYIMRKKDAPAPGDYIHVDSDGQVLWEIKGDRLPVSAGYSMNNYKMHEIDILKGDMIYLFSDGYADQFGGPLGKKFSYKNFKNLLLEISMDPLENQQAKLESRFDEWKGQLSQVDDILVVGIRL